MPGQEITVSGPDGQFMAYLSRPAKPNGAGVVVIQEIFGVNGFVREVADWLASAGYHALAPDLFWRIEPGIQLTDKTEAEWQRAFELYGKFNVDAGVQDIGATIDHLRAVAGGRVGTVGYCLGGLLAYLTAARTDADASVGYYGVAIDQHLDEARRISKPLLLHVAEKDEFVPPDAQARMAVGLAGNARITLETYPGRDHAFARTGGAHYDKAAADLANRRSLDFFAAHLV